MLTLKPRHCFTYDCVIEGGGETIEMSIGWFREHGVLTVGGVRYEVRKQGLCSGRWSLTRDGKVHAEAWKPSVFYRTFHLTGPMGDLVLKADSAWLRGMSVVRGAEVIATIAPIHAFTRKTTIDTRGVDWDRPTLALVCWLTMLLWRRQTSSNSGGGG